MNAEKMSALSIPCEWESIVNNVERHNARVRFDAKVYRHRLKKKISRVISLALGAILSVSVGIAGWMATWIAGSLAVLLVCGACFLGGRIWEGYHK